MAIKEELKSANTSYMFLSGCDVENFKEMKTIFNHYGFSEEDLIGLKRYHSLNIIKCNNTNSAAFVTELPKDIILK